MAIQKTTTTPARRRNQGPTPATQRLWSRLRSGEVWRNVKANFKTDYARFCIGISTLAVSIYMLLCFVSNLFTGPADQGGVQSCNLEHAAITAACWEPTFRTILWTVASVAPPFLFPISPCWWA